MYLLQETFSLFIAQIIIPINWNLNLSQQRELKHTFHFIRLNQNKECMQ